MGHLYRKLASAVGDEEPLLKSNSGKFPTSWSRDGRFLLYTADAEKLSLWVLPLEGERKPFPFLQTDFDNSDGQFSPDGHWVAYVSNESGHDEIYIRTFSPDSKATASDTSGKWLTLSPDFPEPIKRINGSFAEITTMLG